MDTARLDLVPTARYRREVWIVLFVLFVGASVNAASLPGQLLALPAYLPMLALDAFESATGVSFVGSWDVVLVALYYAVAVAVGGAWVALRER
jgi:hypothetical protein